MEIPPVEAGRRTGRKTEGQTRRRIEGETEGYDEGIKCFSGLSENA